MLSLYFLLKSEDTIRKQTTNYNIKSEKLNIDIKKPVDNDLNKKTLSLKEAINKKEEYYNILLKLKENISKKEKVAYITLDDGPSHITPKVLEILKKYEVKATFFVINTNSKYDYLIKKAYEEGHAIGLHSYSHRYDLVYQSDEAYYNDLNMIGLKVETLIGFRPDIIRFPGGGSNTISRRYNSGIMTRLSQSVVLNGYQYYDWNISSGDGSVATKEEIYKYSIDNRGLEKIVLLMHDSGTKQTTIDALEEIIIEYIKQGYYFDYLTKDVIPNHQRIAN